MRASSYESHGYFFRDLKHGSTIGGGLPDVSEHIYPVI